MTAFERPHTTLRLPPARAGGSPRRALAALDDRAEARAIVVHARAGTGKTSLLRSWCARRTGAVAWLSLMPVDRDPVSFWEGVVGALRMAGVDGVDHLVFDSDIDSVLIPKLVNRIDQEPKTVSLVIDDLHLVQDSPVLDQLALLIDLTPDSLLIATAGRTRPRLPIERWHMHNQVIEVDESLLRLDVDEARLVLNDVLGLALSSDEIANLVSQADGWLAAIHILAGTAPHARGGGLDLDRYIERELFTPLPAAIRDALILWSVVPQLSADLADQLATRTDSYGVLSDLADANLFVERADDGGSIFRFSSLSRPMLRDRLRRRSGDERTAHESAARWFEAHGQLTAAVFHWSKLGHHDQIARLVEQNWLDAANAGRFLTILGWLEELPDARISQDPTLSIISAWVSLNLDDAGAVERHLGHAIASMPQHPLPNGISVAGSVALVRSHQCRHRGDAGGSLDAWLEASGHSFAAVPAQMAAARAVHGLAVFWARGTANSRELLSEADKLAWRANEAVTAAQVASHIALADALNGDGPDRASRCLALIEQHGLEAHAVGGPAYAALGVVALGAERFNEATDNFDNALELADRSREPLLGAFVKLHIARTEVQRSDLTRARNAVEEANAALKLLEDPGGWLPDLGVALRTEYESMVPAGPLDEPLHEALTQRERQVLRLLRSRLTLAEIANELYVSHNTIKTHCQRIYRKLDASGRRNAVERASLHGLLALTSKEAGEID